MNKDNDTRIDINTEKNQEQNQNIETKQDDNDDNISEINTVSSSKRKVRFKEDTMVKLKQEELALEDRTELLPYRGFLDIKEMMNTKFAYKEAQLSTTLDIIATYLKGQKLLYLESKSYCEFYLNRLMMPTIFLSSLCSVVSGIFNGNTYSAMGVSGATAFNAFLLAIINYLKLDAKAEAHKMTAYSFDQLISECEFTSGKILLSNGKYNKEDEDENSKYEVEIYDLGYIQNFITNIEKKVKETKEKNQFIIPKPIIEKYRDIYDRNIFTEVKNTQIDEMKLLNQLKVITNDEIDVKNRIIKGEREQIVYDELKKISTERNKLIEKLLDHRKELINIDNNLNRSISIIKKYTRGCFKIFY